MEGHQKGRERLAALLPVVILCGAAAVVLARCFVSFCWSDESYYLTIVHSYWQGARPVADVWRQEQLYSVLLLPFYTLYRAVVGSTEGIYLAVRLLCKLLAVGLSAATYHALQPKGRWAALASALIVLLYSRANIMGFSYYDLSFYFFTAGALLLYGWRPGSPRELWRGVAMGVTLSLAVLCAPFLAVGWVILLPPLFCARFRRYRRLALGVLAGTALAAGVYLLWLLSRVSPVQLLASLPHLFEDPEANARGLKTLMRIPAILHGHLGPAAGLWQILLAYVVIMKLLSIFGGGYARSKKAL